MKAELQGLATKETILKEYPQVFDGLGCLAGECAIEVDTTILPVQQAPRRVAVHLRECLKEKIDELENREVICRVEEPTEWISNIVIVNRQEKLRICLDPLDLNHAIRRPHYQMPTLDDVLPKLAKAKVFSVLDALNGFWQIKLDKPSSYLTTFWTPLSRYRWLCLPFSLSGASNEYRHWKA